MTALTLGLADGGMGGACDCRCATDDLIYINHHKINYSYSTDHQTILHHRLIFYLYLCLAIYNRSEQTVLEHMHFHNSNVFLLLLTVRWIVTSRWQTSSSTLIFLGCSQLSCFLLSSEPESTHRPMTKAPRNFCSRNLEIFSEGEGWSTENSWAFCSMIS